MHLFTLTSFLHDEVAPLATEEQFIKDLEAATGRKFVSHEDDYSSYGTHEQEFIYVRTGGTEGIFKSVFFPENAEPKAVLPAGKTVRILTSGESNSLAASMEIVSFLRLQGREAEIIHGSAEDMAKAIAAGSEVSGNSILKELKPSEKVLDGMRLGVIGRPSDWLISSNVDYAKAAEKLGAVLVDIDINELVAETEKGVYTLPEGMELKSLNAPKYGKSISEADFKLSLDVYGGLKRLAEKYNLQGLTVRCFDLLTSVKSTGCMGLAILNSEGIVATCEGDVPTLLSMAVAAKLAGASFQVNLSKIRNNRLLFAHCTVPFSIVDDYCYDTHFESGIGVAVHGEFVPGPATLVKFGSDLEHFIAEDVTIEANAYGDNLCRTQILVAANKDVENYLLRTPLQNHHVIVPGHHAAEITAKLQ